MVYALSISGKVIFFGKNLTKQVKYVLFGKFIIIGHDVIIVV